MSTALQAIPTLIVVVSSMFDNKRLGGQWGDALSWLFFLSLTPMGYTIAHVLFVFAGCCHNIYKTKSLLLPARHRLDPNATPNQVMHYRFHQFVDASSFVMSAMRLVVYFVSH